ncbi:MAG: hypothetical protein JXB30_04700 [Anaerolineae bacterium]|nr:hypothetical protein [Anaerolineae bacterium]
MSDLTVLLSAATPTDFFIQFFHLVSGRNVPTFELRIIPAKHKGERAIELTVRQNVTRPLPDGKCVFGIESTHVLTLTRDEKIVWEIQDRKPITGLDNIKSALRELQSTDEEVVAPS